MTDLQEIAADLAQLVASTPVEDLPTLIGELETAKARAWARMTAPASGSSTAPATDENLSAEEAARRLGVSRDWLYKHVERLPFVVRIGRRVLFSGLGLEAWNRKRMVR